MNTIATGTYPAGFTGAQRSSEICEVGWETEDYYAFGDALMYGGVRLKQAFGGTGYNGEVRHFPDFASRMYFMESVEKVR